MFKFLKDVYNLTLNYVAYIILGIFGVAIFKLLVLASYTETGKAGLMFVGIFIAIIWAFVRAIKSLKG